MFTFRHHHCSHMPRGPNFVQNGDPMGTQFWVRWGPNGDLRQQKWGPKKRIFENWSKWAYFLKYRGNIQDYSSTKFNFTDKLAWYSFKLVLSSQVFKWSTFNRQWLLWLLARSSAWNRENGDLGKKMGTFWGPKNWKRSPWGPGSPNGDPRGSSALLAAVQFGWCMKACIHLESTTFWPIYIITVYWEVQLDCLFDCCISWSYCRDLDHIWRGLHESFKKRLSADL